MLRTHYKPRTHHRDGYHPSATLAELTRNNGRDVVNASDALLASFAPAARKPVAPDRYVLMADPTTRAALRKFRARQRAARKAAA
jgi:hypothetical protein